MLSAVSGGMFYIVDVSFSPKLYLSSLFVVLLEIVSYTKQGLKETWWPHDWVCIVLVIV